MTDTEHDPTAAMLAATVSPDIRVDVDRVLAVRDQIAAHPETHSQRVYVRDTPCGTARCVAGWATKLNGISDEQVDQTRGDYPGVAVGLMGLRYWTNEKEHVFHDDWSHEETLRNLDAVAAYGKEQQAAAEGGAA